MKMKTRKIYLLLFLAPVAYAKEQPNSLNIDLSATSQMSDNAKRQFYDFLAISERQDIYALGVNGQYNNEWSAASARYRVNRLVYTENSQPEYTTLEGNSVFDLGETYQPAHLNITHSNRSLLSAPDALDISSNRDERSILTVEPSLRWRLTEADLLQASINSSNVTYRKLTQKNSDSAGAQFLWLHEITKVDSLKLQATSTKVKFKTNSALDYQFESVSALYSVNLSHFKYDISVGGNRSIQDQQNQNFSRPSYNITASYFNAYNSLKLNLSQSISNSSMGNGNGSTFIESNLDASSAGLDLINLKTSGVAWDTSAICERCTFSLAAEVSTEEYQILPEDTELRKIKSSFTYRVGRNGIIDLSFVDTNRKFPTSLNKSRDFDTKSYALSYGHTFLHKISVKVFATKYKNESVSLYNSYNENITGLTLNYSF
jgi:hypothetical protein